MVTPSEPGGRSPRDLGRRVRQWRGRQGLTLAQLAEKAGLSIGYVSLVERGLKIPSPEAAASLARALGDDESLFRAWAAALRAGVATSDVNALRADVLPEEDESVEWGETGPREADVVAVRVLDAGADPADPDTYAAPPLFLDRRFLGAEPGDRLFAYEMTPDAVSLLGDVAAPGDHLVFSSRVTRLTPSRIYAVRHLDRVIAARLALVGNRIVIVPPAGHRDVEMVEGVEWRDVVRGVAVVVIRRLLQLRSGTDRGRPGTR